MKPTYTDKSNYLPSNISDTAGQLIQGLEDKTCSPDVSRRTYKSAAMIGLAISLGASGVLMPHQGDEATAEPITIMPTAASPTGAANLSINNQLPVTQERDTSTKVEQSRTELREPQAPVVVTPVVSVVYHQVQAGETLWQLAQKYQVSSSAIAQANNFNTNVTLAVGQVLKIPSANTIQDAQLGETNNTSPTYGVPKAQLQPIATRTTGIANSPLGNASDNPSNAEPIFQSRQNDALQNLRTKRDQLRENLGGWRTERTVTPGASGQNSLIAGGGTNSPVTPTSGWLGTSQVNGRSGLNPTDRSSVVALQSPVVAGTATPKESSSSNLPNAPVVIAPTAPVKDSAATNSPQASAVSSIANPLGTTANTQNSGVNLANNLANNQRQPTVLAVTPPAPVVVTPSSLPSVGNANWINNSPNSNTATTNPAPSGWVAHLPEQPNPSPILTNQDTARRGEEIHRVKAGETLDAIARQYGVSRQELVRVNGISNPNFLLVNQRLTIPAAPLVNGATPNVIAINNSPRVSSTYDLTPPPVVTTIAALPQATQGNFFGQAPIEPAPTANQVSQDELVIERLRADIRRMREEYQQQQRASQPILPSQSPTPIASVGAATTLPRETPSRPERINPQFRAVSEAQLNQPTPPAPQILAVAPTPTANYNTILQLPIGQVVSPELPPLAAADSYLPNSPARFNGYIWPAEGVLTSGYGVRWGRMHSGIDIAAPIGTPIMAAAGGVVITAGWNDGGYGNLVEIRHPDGSVTLYGHNDRILVREGQQVAQGEQISEMGTTGFSTGPHLHFEVHPTGAGAVNPIAMLPRE